MMTIRMISILVINQNTYKNKLSFRYITFDCKKLFSSAFYAAHSLADLQLSFAIKSVVCNYRWFHSAAFSGRSNLATVPFLLRYTVTGKNLVQLIKIQQIDQNQNCSKNIKASNCSISVQ